MPWTPPDPEIVGDGTEPDGLCGNKDDHLPHLHDSATLGRFWCTADQSKRLPYAAEVRRRAALASENG